MTLKKLKQESYKGIKAVCLQSPFWAKVHKVMPWFEGGISPNIEERISYECLKSKILVPLSIRNSDGREIKGNCSEIAVVLVVNIYGRNQM